MREAKPVSTNALLLVVCLALAVFLFRKRGVRPFAFFPLAIALIGGGLIAPAMFLGRVSVTPTEITTIRGFWFAPSISAVLLWFARGLRLWL